VAVGSEVLENTFNQDLQTNFNEIAVDISCLCETNPKIYIQTSPQKINKTVTSIFIVVMTRNSTSLINTKNYKILGTISRRVVVLKFISS
jgi:hypothetical protein